MEEYIRLEEEKARRNAIVFNDMFTSQAALSCEPMLVQRIVHRCLQQDDIYNGDHVQAVAATDDSPAIPEHTTVETLMNMSPANKAHFEAKKEAIHLILTGIGDEIYSTVDACQTAQEMWEAIKRLQQSESLNIQDTASVEDINPEQAQRDKDMQKNLALITKYFKKIYKPTNNNLRTSSNSRNKNVDTTPWYKNDNHSGQFGNQRTVNVAEARENVGSLVVQQSGIQCFNCKEFDTDEEIDEQELEAHYSYMAKIQEVPTADTSTDSEPLEQVQNDTGYNVFANDLQHFEQSESISNTHLVETDDSNFIPDLHDMCDDDIQNDQNDVENDDERVALANLIANLKLDVDKNKKIQKQLKKANTTLAQELKECKTILAKTSKTLGESNSVQDSCLVALQNKQTEFENSKAFNDRTVDYDKLERKLNKTLGQLALKDIEIKEGLKTKAYEISVVKEKHDRLIKQSILTKSHYEGLVKQKTKHMTGNLKLLCNFVEKFMGTVRFGNDQFVPIMSYGDLVQGNITITRVYYVEDLNHSLFSVGQFCDADLEVAFRKSTCFVRDLQGNDLLIGSNPKDTQPTTNIQPTSAPSTPTYVHAEENNDNQTEEEHLPDDQFTNPFCAPA
nr:integrase, catalytic region, zinc finger, CCHC-type, peptidase aspartic, catalytic [Tanacetum cinerariifolium]